MGWSNAAARWEPARHWDAWIECGLRSDQRHFAMKPAVIAAPLAAVHA
jgi:hypothetical protein